MVVEGFAAGFCHHHDVFNSGAVLSFDVDAGFDGKGHAWFQCQVIAFHNEWFLVGG